MRQVSLAVAGAAAIWALGACASPGDPAPASSSSGTSSSDTSSPGTSSPGTSSPGTSSPGTSSSTPGEGTAMAIFPLHISRTGGIAGVQDTLVVEGDGVATVTSRRGVPRRCRIRADVMDRLTVAVSTVPWDRVGPASPQARYPDDLVTLVGLPGRGPARLDDALLGNLSQPVGDLLNDTTGNPPPYRLCIPG